jgi:hypothetical protein
MVGNTLNFSGGNVGIGTTTPTDTLQVVGTSRHTLLIADKGMYSFSGINTDAGTYTNQWQKVCSFGNPANLFDYATFVMRVDVGGSTDHSNTSADVYISYKQQSSNWYVYANIINYGKTPLDVSDFEILLDSATETVTVYHKIVKNYSNPVYTYLGNSPAGLVNYGTIIGASLAGQPNDPWNEKYITNGLTSNVVNGNLGIGTTTPTEKLDVAGKTKTTTFQLTTTPTAGYVLTSDASGNGTWQAASGGVNIYNTDGTLNADRVVTMNNFGLTFDGLAGANGTQLNLTAPNPNRSKALNFKVGSGLRWKQQVSGSEIGGDIGSQLAMQYYDDAGVLKGTAFSISRTNGAFRLNNAYNLPTAAGTLGQVMRTNGSGIVSFQSLPVEIQVAASDETTPLTLGNGKITFRMPHGMTLTEVRASLTTAQVSGAIFRIDVIQNGVSVLSTKCTIDNTERTSTMATTLPVISVSALADDSEMRVDIIQVGDGTAKGLKVTLIGTRA